MGVTLPLTAEGQKGEKNNGGNKEIEKEGINGGKSYGSERRETSYKREAYNRVGRERGD